ncbi:hypothetical protein [Marinimicrobium sp. ABcell2]|uniref:hypothetical protein n=1 Tax=Marinimicrobium sp. ABcell2 TaxID=3069751 RepID=UPI0027B86A13|nr:hypothetical protein [Marinimicrobium sp. ABcell2]MDQ2077555.1 hypothetical protein [Marinimicrobium sp. ABcell2]
MIKVAAIGCFLFTVLTVGSVSAVAVIAESRLQDPVERPAIPTRLRKPYVVATEGESERFVVGSADQGFRELKHLFLGAISGAESISECCDKINQSKISLHLASAHFIRVGNEVVIIEKVDMVWPRGWRNKKGAYLVLNDRLAITPNPSSRSFNLLAEWARERGFE